MFKSWDELSELEQLQCIYSDAYKDAYGFRPRGEVSNDVEWYRAQLKSLSEVISEQENAERLAENKAIERFEKLVADTIEIGAKNRQNAIRWIVESLDVNGDLEYACYKLGLPYNYFKGK